MTETPEPAYIHWGRTDLDEYARPGIRYRALIPRCQRCGLALVREVAPGGQYHPGCVPKGTP
jgi:hypothetical protein